MTQSTENISQNKTSGKCLLLGGSYFIGKKLRQYLQQRERYDLFLANRNSTGAPEAGYSQIIIDRNDPQQCTTIADNVYGLVIDCSCYTPEQFQNCQQYIETQYYVFISSAYATCDDPNHPLYNYGQNKLACEQLVKQHYPKHLIVRPGFVTGDGDYLDRFYTDAHEVFYYLKEDDSLLSEHIDVDFLATTVTNLIHYQETGCVMLGMNG